MMIATSSSVNRIVIAGAGFEGWLTAAALGKHLDGKRVEITVCAVDGADTWDSLYAVLPANPDDLLHQLGFRDSDLASRLDASFSLGARVEGLALEQPFLPYGTTGVDHNGTPFHHHWKRVGGVGNYFDYSPAVRAMALRSFAPPLPQNAIGSLQHEYARHVAPERLVAPLKEVATKFGASQSLSSFASVQLSANGNRIERLLAKSGEKVEGDLFIDCTGPQRALLSTVSSIDWLNAPGFGSFDLRIDSTPSSAEPSPWHDVEASEDGWQVSIPTASGTAVLALQTNGETFVPGNLSRPWDGNCVALGNAAACILPLTPLHTHLLMVSIGRIVRLLPGPDMLPAETREYNQLYLRDIAEIHDYLAVLERVRNEDSLDGARAHASLQRRLSLFATRGWIPKSDSDVIAAHEWVALFLLFGLVPKRYDRLAEMVPGDVVAHSLVELSGHIDKVVSEFPPLADYLLAAKEGKR